jgi:hypothetical protein
MKTFAEYLVESKHTYDYRIKIAGDVDPDFIKEFESKLKQFDVVKMTKPKTTPVQKTVPDFPKFANESVTFMDVTFNYPATPAQITQIAQLLGLDPNRICVLDTKYSDSIDQENDKQAKENKDVLTDTDYPAPDKEQKDLSKDYAADPYDHAVLKNSYRSDFSVAGGKTPPAVTSNDYPMGMKSPVGSNQNRLPHPKSSAR